MDTDPRSDDEKLSATDAYESREPTAQPSVEPKKRRKNHLRRAVIGAVIGAAIIGYLQWNAPAADHQIANMLSVVIGLLTATWILIKLQFFSMQRGRWFLVPLGTITLVGMLVTLFRFEGFSGEMLPQFQPRFGQPPPAMRSLGDGAAASARDGISTELPVAEADSNGFLGNDRTGVIAERLFDVPTDESQVETLWNQGIGEGWSSFAVSGDRAVTLEQRDESECVTCYRLSDGELLWMVKHEAYHFHPLGGAGPRSTPTIDSGHVYAQGADGSLWCLNLKSGETIWMVDLLDLAGWDKIQSEAAIAWGRSGSPLIVDGLCVVPFGGPKLNSDTGRSLVALDAETGKVRWAAGEDQISYASPGLMTLGEIRQIVSVNEKTITGHEVETGKVLWDFEWPGQSNGSANCAMAIPAGPNRFVVGKGYGGGSALVEVMATDDGSLAADAIWDSTRNLKTKFTHACIYGDVAYAIGNGSLEAVSLVNGERLWTQPRRSRFGQGQILLVDDVIVAQSESGEVALVAADESEYRELFRLSAMDSKTWNIPTIAGRHLLVRNDRQAICFVLPKRGE